MKAIFKSALPVLILLMLSCLTVPGYGAPKIRVLVVTGGHKFQTNEFFQVFKDNPEITFTAAGHPNALEKLRPAEAANYDVMVLYDLWQKITEENKADFIEFLKAGKGLVILHHAVANYQQWPEYEKILGGRYYLQKTMVGGVEKARSQPKEGIQIQVHVEDSNHPITRGIKDFEIHDEGYKGYDVSPDSHLLLSTVHSNNAPTVAWTRTYDKARVTYLQLGHDRLAYDNPSFRQLLAQSIRWVGKRD